MIATARARKPAGRPPLPRSIKRRKINPVVAPETAISLARIAIIENSPFGVIIDRLVAAEMDRLARPDAHQARTDSPVSVVAK